MTENEYIKLHILLEHVLEGDASDHEYVGLQKIISQNESLQTYYFRYIELQAGLHQLKRLDSVCPLTPEHLSGFLSVLGEQEEEAEGVELKTDPPVPERLIQRVVHEKTVRKINKASLITAIVSLAAVIFLVVFANFAPVGTGSEVASLSDSINAKWADSDMLMDAGARLRTGDAPLLLREGLAELTFDNNARVTIEAPAEFKLLTNDQIKLNYGRLYAVVPQEAVGFTVSTHSSKIIDLGTEFGVQEDLNGSMELHVTKGKTLLTATGAGEKSILDVIAGQARKVFAGNSRIQVIPLQDNNFVRKIDSKTRFIWKGQNRLSLTDLVMGGDGYHTSTASAIEYNPLNGQQSSPRTSQYEPGSGGYVKVADKSCIDGIFVPNGKTEPVIVSSAGHRFESCPETTGLFYSSINILKNWKFYEPVQSAYEKYRKDASTSSLIYLHSNIGITFDLQKIRQTSNMKLLRFNTFVATVQSLNNNVMGTQEYSEYDVWVLVDGQIRFSAKALRFDGSREISIELSDRDRFLSLAVTDGQVVYFSEKPANHFDTCGFADPVFEVEPK